MTGQSDRVETLAVWRTIVVAATTNGRETGVLVKTERRVPVPHFEMDARHWFVTCPFQKVVKEQASDAASLPAGRDGDQEELRFIGYRAEQRKTDSRAIIRLASKDQRHA